MWVGPLRPGAEAAPGQTIPLSDTRPPAQPCGFGAGGGSGAKSGPSAGTGAGGGIKPVGAVIIDSHGARVEGVQGPMTSLAHAIGDTATKVLKERRGSGEPE